MISSLLSLGLLGYTIATPAGHWLDRLIGDASESVEKWPEIDMRQNYNPWPSYPGRLLGKDEVEPGTWTNGQPDPRTLKLIQLTADSNGQRPNEGHRSKLQEEAIEVQRIGWNSWHPDHLISTRAFDVAYNPVERSSTPHFAASHPWLQQQSPADGTYVSDPLQTSEPSMTRNRESVISWLRPSPPPRAADPSEQGVLQVEVTRRFEQRPTITRNLIDRVGIIGSDHQNLQEPNVESSLRNSYHTINGQPTDLRASYYNPSSWQETSMEEVQSALDNRKRRHSRLDSRPDSAIVGKRFESELIDYLHFEKFETGSHSRKKLRTADLTPSLAKSPALSESNPSSSFAYPAELFEPTSYLPSIILTDAQFSPTCNRYQSYPTQVWPELGAHEESSIGNRREWLESNSVGLIAQNRARFADTPGFCLSSERASPPAGYKTTGRSAKANLPPSDLCNAHQVEAVVKTRGHSKLEHILRGNSFQFLQENITKLVMVDYFAENGGLADQHSEEKDIPTFIHSLNGKLKNILERRVIFPRGLEKEDIPFVELSSDHEVFRLIGLYRKQLRPDWLKTNNEDSKALYQRRIMINEVVYQNAIRACAKWGLAQKIQDFLHLFMLRVQPNCGKESSPHELTARSRTMILLVQGVVVRFLYHLILLHQCDKMNFSNLSIDSQEKVNQAFQVLQEFWLNFPFERQTPQILEKNVFYKVLDHKIIQKLRLFRVEHGRVDSENGICHLLQIEFFSNGPRQIVDSIIKGGLNRHFVNFFNDIALIDWLANSEVEKNYRN